MKKKLYNAVSVLVMASALLLAVSLQEGYFAGKEKDTFEKVMPQDIETTETETTKVKTAEMKISEREIAETEETGTEASWKEMYAAELEQLCQPEEGLENSPGELSVWEGKYTFEEMCPASNPDAPWLMMFYVIKIYPDGQGGHCADVEIDGRMTYDHFLANVYGDGREVHLYFKETLHEADFPECPGGELPWYSLFKYLDPHQEIMSLSRDENTGNIYTTLGKLNNTILLNVNREAGGIWLEKVDLSPWEGRYVFHEPCPPGSSNGVQMGMDYVIEIYPDGKGEYYANVRIDGYQIYYFFRAHVQKDYSYQGEDGTRIKKNCGTISLFLENLCAKRENHRTGLGHSNCIIQS